MKRVISFPFRLTASSTSRACGSPEARYGYRPVLLETFIDTERFRGTCYRAANWISVGQTQGRGKLDRQHRPSLPVKEILLYPLHKSFRRKLLDDVPFLHVRGNFPLREVADVFAELLMFRAEREIERHGEFPK